MRGIKSAENLVASVEGDIEDVDGILKITKIRLKYRFKIPPGTREKAERALENSPEKCPAYQSVKGCIECSWEAEMEEA
ncbi:MAG: OsmC family protein [Desulfobacteraceae bacterium]|nr:OsmC family protein [Desulfobacteraceae bacterium]